MKSSDDLFFANLAEEMKEFILLIVLAFLLFPHIMYIKMLERRNNILSGTKKAVRNRKLFTFIMWMTYELFCAEFIDRKMRNNFCSLRLWETESRLLIKNANSRILVKSFIGYWELYDGCDESIRGWMNFER